MQFIEKIAYIYIEKDEGSTTSIKTPSHYLKESIVGKLFYQHFKQDTKIAKMNM